jgi:hypothetical protein
MPVKITQFHMEIDGIIYAAVQEHEGYNVYVDRYQGISTHKQYQLVCRIKDLAWRHYGPPPHLYQEPLAGMLHLINIFEEGCINGKGQNPE